MNRSSLFLAATLAAVGACSGSDTQLVIAYAPGFTPGAAQTISVFGVFKEGRMNSEVWELIGSELSHAFANGTCESAYTRKLKDADPELYATIDREARAEGVTETLIEHVAPSAQGGLIMIVDLWGTPATPHTPPPGGGNGGVAPTGGPPAGGGGRGGFGGAGSRMPPSRPASASHDEGKLEIRASFYSVSSHAFVAAQKMTYTGKENDEAVKRFAAELAKTVPNAKCVGWSWKPKS